MSAKIPSDEIALIGQKILRAVQDETIGDTLEALEIVRAFLVAKVMAPTEHCMPPSEWRQVLRPTAHTAFLCGYAVAF
jgi:hypothetical protein